MMNDVKEREETLCMQVLGNMDNPKYKEILSKDALKFLEAIIKKFGDRRHALLNDRDTKQAQYDDGELPNFRKDTVSIRQNKEWKVATPPPELLDRRVEITGPIERKMVINALNSGAKVFMCCFEDASSPTWANMVEGQINLRDANLGTISYFDEKKQKRYQLNDDPALLIARPRGIHLPEQSIQFNNQPIGGCLMDFALYFFHNYQSRAQKDLGVYYYIPKLESMEEAQWWDDIFSFTESYFQVPKGTIRATVLIETLPAVFQMEEILYAMRDHIVAMNCGRWDYIFSYIKTLKNHKDRILPDRHGIGMDQEFLNAYSQLLVRTCHARGALAMGGMSAFIPAKDPQEMARVTAKVIEDKQRESQNGHDGTWVAHPALVDLAMSIFDKHLDGKVNQMNFQSPEHTINADTLLKPCEGSRDETGVRKNIRIALYYIEAWIQGYGCVPIYGLMEDAATAEISRANIWQWIHHGVTLDDGQTFTKSLFHSWLYQELDTIKHEVGDSRYAAGRFEETADLFYQLSTAEEFAAFLTLPSYGLLQESS
ncbi:malate synthase A [Vibrio sp. 10N.261.46.E12]|uniref:malate synthase A n=1 Tax=unclassified Vibrio TaxID=2614977 RepID=UPI0009757C7E|nr:MULTISPECIES: malate synthase A [unclassified Vibrio]OMO38077.1 malate synthase A [Vibrio sp. 10N.261.45.E1]PMJ35135.1 malate synthase A [Vibrio sp. 10N.286.45.B6]PML92442.1 malate synthase A [Vibrio sp. 10N.261.49.E11]PMM71283.1 malate synthase A [Vibrio sp. 10N.261.46.F12]PMM88010.1 malate synthase A [Vibrio sp. 10N.261.46.E8]